MSKKLQKKQKKIINKNILQTYNPSTTGLKEFKFKLIPQNDAKKITE